MTVFFKKTTVFKKKHDRVFLKRGHVWKRILRGKRLQDYA